MEIIRIILFSMIELVMPKAYCFHHLIDQRAKRWVCSSTKRKLLSNTRVTINKSSICTEVFKLIIRVCPDLSMTWPRVKSKILTFPIKQKLIKWETQCRLWKNLKLRIVDNKLAIIHTRNTFHTKDRIWTSLLKARILATTMWKACPPIE